MKNIIKCNLELLKSFGISYNWLTIYVGIVLDLIDYTVVSRYATEELSNSTNVEISEIIELACCNSQKNKVEITNSLEKIIGEKPNNFDNNFLNEKNKWLYCVLKNLSLNINDSLELLKEIEIIYSDFNYPEEMECFIIYMPCKDSYNPEEHTFEENINRLINIFNNYLIQKYKTINNM